MITPIDKHRIIEECKEGNFSVNEDFLNFIQDDHIQIDAVFGYGDSMYFIFNRTLPPTNNDDIGIFKTLVHYGSSGRYKGLIDSSGNILFQPNYICISQFVGGVLLVQDKSMKYGLFSISGTVLLPCSYEKIYPYRELVFGACKDGKVGFMDIDGKTVIPFKYLPSIQDAAFYNGIACVLDEDGFIYINHKGELQFQEHFRYHQDFEKSLEVVNSIYVDLAPDYREDWYCLYLNGDMRFTRSDYYENTERIKEQEMKYYSEENIVEVDDLDAYEGDVSAKWNTD